MSVTRMRVTASKLLPRIQEAAKSSSNVVFVPDLNRRSMAGLMTFHQAMSCLRLGKIVGKPTMNEHDHWELRMERYAANRTYSLRVIAECDGARVSRLIVFPQIEQV